MNFAFNFETLTARSVQTHPSESATASNQPAQSFTESLRARLIPSSGEAGASSDAGSLGEPRTQGAKAPVEAETPREVKTLGEANTLNDPSAGQPRLQTSVLHDVPRSVARPHVPVILSPALTKLTRASVPTPCDAQPLESQQSGKTPSHASLKSSVVPMAPPRSVHRGANLAVPPAPITTTVRVNSVPNIADKAAVSQSYLSTAPLDAVGNVRIQPAAPKTAHNSGKQSEAVTTLDAVVVNSVVPEVSPTTLPLIAPGIIDSRTADDISHTPQKIEDSLFASDASLSPSARPNSAPQLTLLTGQADSNISPIAPIGATLPDPSYPVPNTVKTLPSTPIITAKTNPHLLATAIPATVIKNIKPALPGITQNTAENSSTTPTTFHLHEVLSISGDRSQALTLLSEMKASPVREAAPPTPDTKGQESPKPPVPEPVISGETALGANLEQVAPLIQTGATPIPSSDQKVNLPPVSPQSAVEVSNGTPPAGSATGNHTEASRNQQSSDQPQSQTGSQNPSPNWAGPTPLDQNVTLTPTNFFNQIGAPIEHAVETGVPAPLQSINAAPGHTAKLSDNAPPALPSLSPALPAIQTAKLIQNLGQTEMHVGMRSADFGNISINTSATRDVISAQISLEHGDLARTLAIHLPEMQAKLSNSHQAMDVRIDLNGQAAGQGTGSSPDTSNGSAGGSRGGRQQNSNATPAQTTGRWMGQTDALSPPTPTGEVRLTGRLDITA